MSDAYDPTAPEGERSHGSQYISRKDVRVILVILVLVAIVLVPIYRVMERKTWKAVCIQNMRSISTALQAYAAAHDERFPPLYAEGLGGGHPLVFEKQAAVFTWASEISSGMSPRSSFLCPASDPSEAVTTLSERQVDQDDMDERNRPKDREPLTYGMYAAYSGFPTALVSDPNQTIVIAETSNMGSMGSFDPVKYVNRQGDEVPFDAFSIAWDTGNAAPNAATMSVTRLAFHNVEDDPFARHDHGINALTASGGAVVLKPGAELISRTTAITGKWAVPASLGR